MLTILPIRSRLGWASRMPVSVGDDDEERAGGVADRLGPVLDDAVRITAGDGVADDGVGGHGPREGQGAGARTGRWSSPRCTQAARPNPATATSTTTPICSSSTCVGETDSAGPAHDLATVTQPPPRRNHALAWAQPVS